MAPRSPKPTAEGSTPSGPADAPGIQFGHQHLDNRIGTLLVGAVATTGSDHGSVAPWGAAVRKTAVDRHRGFDSLPTHYGASLLTGREPGSYPGRDRVRGPGRAPCRRSSARWKHPPVTREVRGSSPLGGARCRRGPMEKTPVYETGGCRFDPCRRRSTRRSSAGSERRPPKAEVARSNRAGGTQALVAQEARALPWYGRGRGCDTRRGLLTWKGSGQMRSRA